MTEIKKRITGHKDYLKKQWKKEKRNSTRSVLLLQDINFEVSQVGKNVLWHKKWLWLSNYLFTKKQKKAKKVSKTSTANP